ncbi:hypothetical protein [uncultured Ferrimonas sp.]|uniref:hypothetical protein n=1 Tax=uncultured Ferrimonas sp. TaxID=432640 RepID=UPI0026266A81|nr:hypothetical protein [uncultured Ferrimonas sp.]
MMKKLALVAVAVMASAGVQAADIEGYVSYDNNHTGEGRTSLDGAGITWAGVAAGFENGVAVAVDYGYSDEKADYDELAITVEYGFNAGDFAMAAAYTRLEMFEDNEDDNEFAFGVAYEGCDLLVPSLDAVYSTEAEGSFVELGLTAPYQINEQLALEAFVVAGFDFGYATEDNDGYNHTSVGAAASYAINDNLAFNLGYAYHIAGSDIDKEMEAEGLSADNESVVTVGLSFAL